MSEDGVFVIGKQYIVKKEAEDGLDMYCKSGTEYSNDLKYGEIVTLQKDNEDECGFMLVRTNGDMSGTIYGDQIHLYLYLKEINTEDIKVDNNKVVNENQINYEDEYNRLVEMHKELTQENEDLKKALVKTALKL